MLSVRWADALSSVAELAKNVLKGDRRSIAKAITIVENNAQEAQKLVAALYSHSGKAHVVGITGPGGAGKSTLAEKIVREYRCRGKSVGVVAVDPSSPFTGGAFLGDRIRMQELTMDEGVFIRSMATRNFAGGIARATKDAVMILDAAGKDMVIVETAGAGQSEVEVVKVADSVVVVHAPGLGDEIQAIKAGMMEIADVFVVNKADRDSANKTAMDIQGILQLSGKEGGWKPSVLKTVALTGEGVKELVDKLEEHRASLKRDLKGQKRVLRAKAEAELVEAIKQRVVGLIVDDLRVEGKLEAYLQMILRREKDPVSAAQELLREKGLE